MLDITKSVLNIDCPKCKSKNPFTFGQVQKKEPIICKGCGIKIILSDNGSIEKAQKDINNSLKELSEQIKKTNKSLKIRI